MKSLPERIMEHAEAMPEATPICPAALLHLGPKGRSGSGALSPGPFRPAHADPPRGLHAPDRVPLRAVCAGHRKVLGGQIKSLTWQIPCRSFHRLTRRPCLPLRRHCPALVAA